MTKENIDKIKKEFDKYRKEYIVESEPEDYIHIGLDSSFQFSDFRKDIENILKENTKQTIQDMLVEEKGQEVKKHPMYLKRYNEEVEELKGYDIGFNQCCALQQKKGQKILNKIKL